MSQTKTKYLLVLLLAALGTFCYPNVVTYLGKSVSYTNVVVPVSLVIINCIVLRWAYPSFKETTKRNKTFAVLFAFILSVCLHLGKELEIEGYVTFTDKNLYISIIAFTCYMSFIINIIWEKVLLLTKRIPATKRLSETIENKESIFGKIFDKPLLTSFIILLLWTPVFLALYPGAFVYDAQDEYVQVAARTFTMHHPLLHVLLLGGSIRAAEHFGLHANIGIACYTLFQMIVVSLVFGYFFYLLKKWGINHKYRIAMLLIIGLFPIFPMYAVCTAKDTLFTTALFLSILLLLEEAKDHDVFYGWNRKRILFILTSTAMCLLRNNGVYALVVTFVAYIVVMLTQMIKANKDIKRDEKNKNTKMVKITLSILFALLLYVLFSNGLRIACQATDNEHQEILTVPIQQIARAYQFAPEAFSEEDVETLHEILSEEALNTYSPKISDIIKSQFDNVAYAKNPAKYRNLWMKVGMKKPFIYLNAWLLTSYGYWYPDAVINPYGGIPRFTFTYTESSYFGFETEPPGVRDSKFPLLEEFYRKLSLELFQQRVPVLAWLFSPGFLFFSFFAGWSLLLREKQYPYVLALLPVVLIWLTVLLGPTALVRYVLILWFIILVIPFTLQFRTDSGKIL